MIKVPICEINVEIVGEFLKCGDLGRDHHKRMKLSAKGLKMIAYRPIDPPMPRGV